MKKQQNKRRTGFWLVILVWISFAGYQQDLYAQNEKIKPPEGMVLIPSGTNESGEKMAGFFMDISPVTVQQYDAFIRATGYVDDAHKYGSADVFDTVLHRWKMTEGANYLYPYGPDKPKAEGDMPATQVSWNDAIAYCNWAGKRLPTAKEWIYAAMNADGNYNKEYPWGNELIENGKYMANVWQGNFPYKNTVADGYAFAAPVGIFGKTILGLTDLGGNVWEWIEDWKNIRDTTGPDAQKLQMGGSFLCDINVCHGYKIGRSASSTPNSSLCHVGFRCVTDISGAD